MKKMLVQNIQHTLILGSILTSIVYDHIKLKIFFSINTELHENDEFIT
jgi:hypothetical protein